jgi:hypothetical protein
MVLIDHFKSDTRSHAQVYDLAGEWSFWVVQSSGLGVKIESKKQAEEHLLNGFCSSLSIAENTNRKFAHRMTLVKHKKAVPLFDKVDLSAKVADNPSMAQNIKKNI